MDAFHVTLPDGLKEIVDIYSENYNGETILTEETGREEQTKQRIAMYKQKLVEEPHFEIALKKMQIQFDPRNIMPLEDKGTVYPNISIIDVWGILRVTDGALMSPAWNKVTVTNPVNMDGQNLSGDGWTLELNEGYSVIIIDGNFSLKKE